MERKISDIKDMWIEKNGEAKFIKEGDVVLLHNWGINNKEQVIGVAILYWDEEYHGWNFNMVEGDYVDDQYDMWRQSPRVIGYVKNDSSITNYNKYDELVIVEEEFKKWNCAWEELIKLHSLEAIKKWQLKEKNILLKSQNKRAEELKKQLKKIENEAKKIEENIEKINKGGMNE